MQLELLCLQNLGLVGNEEKGVEWSDLEWPVPPVVVSDLRL